MRPGPSEHGPVLTFEDVASLSDLGRYAYRAKMLDDEAAIRLQAFGRVLAAWVGVLPGSGILGEGVRQALLRDPTYLPALNCARAFVA